MYKSTVRNGKRNHSSYDLYGDIAKIKAALADVTFDAKGLAKEAISQSLDDMREKTVAAQENISTYVSGKPFKSIGIALIAGWLLGFLMRK